MFCCYLIKSLMFSTCFLSPQLLVRLSRGRSSLQLGSMTSSLPILLVLLALYSSLVSSDSQAVNGLSMKTPGVMDLVSPFFGLEPERTLAAMLPYVVQSASPPTTKTSPPNVWPTADTPPLSVFF